MYCSSCDNTKELKGKKITKRFTESGLDNVVLKGVIEYRCPKCGEVYYNYGNLQQLLRVLADALLTKEDLLTPNEVRFLRTYIGYSSSYFAKVLGYDVASYSRLENGKNKITSTFDRHVREAVFNKAPDRNYDLHDKMLNEPTKVKDFTLNLKSKKWTLLGAPALT